MQLIASRPKHSNTDVRTPYVYVLVRTDIPLEHQITQACHAALEVGFDHHRPSVQQHDNPQEENSPVHLITLAVPDERELMATAGTLSVHGIRHHLFFEPDHYQEAPMGYTALASAPIYGVERKLFRRYALWRPSVRQHMDAMPSTGQLTTVHVHQ